MDIKPYLKFMVDKNASDIFFITGVPVHIRVNGPCISVGDAVMQSASLKKLAYSIMNDSQIKEFEADHDYSFAISVAGLGRFRFNIFKQRGDVAIVVRYIL
ncbi:MAG: pilus assembly protein PilU, partial [Pseudomonadota bacterium]